MGFTGNLSHIRSKPRPPIHRRDWTRAQKLLHQHQISHRDIEERCGVALATICRALTLKHFHKTNFSSVVFVRRAAEELLTAHGVDYDPATLWADYDDLLDRQFSNRDVAA